MARTTGLEPATTGVTGRYSNRLSYVPALGPRSIAAGRGWDKPFGGRAWESGAWRLERSWVLCAVGLGTRRGRVG